MVWWLCKPIIVFSFGQVEQNCSGVVATFSQGVQLGFIQNLTEQFFLFINQGESIFIDGWKLLDYVQIRELLLDQFEQKFFIFIG